LLQRGEIASREIAAFYAVVAFHFHLMLTFFQVSISEFEFASYAQQTYNKKYVENLPH
jgi:hypothetical protein